MAARGALALVCGLLCTWPAGAALDGGKAAEIAGALARYNRHADMPLPVPPADGLEALAEGRVVDLRERQPLASSDGESADRIRVVGYRLIERPRLLVWLAALDLGTEHTDRITEHLVAVDAAGGSVWYQHLRLPWPLRDRHWVIRNYKAVELTAASDGMIWEHAWRLEEAGDELAADLLQAGRVDGLDERTQDRAIYLPVNRGGWAMLAVGPRSTLVAAHVITVLGGWIPDGLVARLTSRQLERMLDNLEPRSYEVHEEYDASYPVFRGDGRLITVEMARHAALEAGAAP